MATTPVSMEIYHKSLSGTEHRLTPMVGGCGEQWVWQCECCVVAGE